MTLSARNQLAGTVEELVLGGVMAHVVVRVGENLIESVITRRSAEAQKGRCGQRRYQVHRSHAAKGLTVICGGEDQWNAYGALPSLCVH